MEKKFHLKHNGPDLPTAFVKAKKKNYCKDLLMACNKKVAIKRYCVCRRVK